MKKYLFDAILRIENEFIQDLIIEYIEDLEEYIEELNHGGSRDYNLEK